MPTTTIMDRYLAGRYAFFKWRYNLVLINKLGLALVMRLTLWQTLLKGVIPFILIDLIKATLAASVSSAILPRVSYNGEIDKKE